MTATVPPVDGDPAALAAAVLEEESRRQAEQATRGTPVVIGDDQLPGVGDDAVPLRSVLRTGGYSIIGVTFGLNFLDEFDRAAFALLGPDIQKSLGVSDTAIGAAAAIGGVVVLLAAVPLGYLADRYRRTTLLGAFALVWSAATVFSGLVTSSWQLFAGRIASGIGKATEGPVQKSLIADAYPIAGRSRVYALHGMANPIGFALTPLVAGGVTVLVGGPEAWRWAFFLVATPGILLGLYALVQREPQRGKHELESVLGAEGAASAAEEELRVPLGAAFTRLKQVRTFYYLLSALGALGFGFVTLPVYQNLILEEDFGLGTGGRTVVAVVTGLGGIIGVIVGGSYGDRLFRRDPELSMRLIALGVGSFGVTVPIQVYMPTVELFVVVGFISGAATTAAFVPANAIIAAVCPYRLRALGFALVGIYIVLIGGLGGALITGSLSEAYGSQLAVATVVPPAAFVGSYLLFIGARYVRSDMAAVVAELREEQAEAQRVLSGADVPALQIRNLDFSYGPVQVLFDVSIDVQRGEVLALLGTNGAGKSTVLRAVNGLGLPDRGVIRVNGRTITLASPGARVRLGVVQVPGGKAVFPSLSVEENLLVGASTFYWDTERLTSRVETVLELFPKLRERLDQPAGTLSGGEQQMLALAKAMLLDPEILIIDELSLGLAPIVVQELLEVLDRLKQRGVTMIIVEQSVNVALAVADRAVFMEKGQVRFSGPAADLLERDDLVRAVFLGGEGG